MRHSLLRQMVVFLIFLCSLVGAVDAVAARLDVFIKDAEGRFSQLSGYLNGRLTIQATPNDGEKVSEWWYYDSDPLGRNPAKRSTKLSVTGNTINLDYDGSVDKWLVAECEYVEYTIKYVVDGTQKGSVTKPYNESTTVDSIPNPPGGYTYPNVWSSSKGGTVNPGASVNGSDFGDGNEDFDIALSVAKIPQCYSISIKQGEGGTGGSVSPDNYNTSTEQQEVEITPPTWAWHTLAWTVSGAKGGTPSVKDNVLTIPQNTYGDLTLTPTWTQVKYSLSVQVDSLDKDKGKVNPEGVVQYDGGAQVELIAQPNDGYAFKQWSDGSTEAKRTIAVTNNLSFTASFTNRLFTITFDPQGGTFNEGETNQMTIPYMGTIGDLPKVSYIGHAHKGWFRDPWHEDQTSAAQQAVVQQGDKYEWPTNMTFYAHWEKLPEVEITCLVQPSKAAGGVDIDGSPNSDTTTVAKVGATVTLTAVASNGYSFAWWIKNEQKLEDGPEIVFPVNMDVAYTAVFMGNVYKVTFVPGDDASVKPSSKSVTFGSPYGELPQPQWVGEGLKMFVGWHDQDSDEGWGNLIDSNSVVSISASHNLYAKFDDVPFYFIEYHGNGATNENAMAQDSYIVGVATNLSPNLYGKVGYAFMGWATNVTDAAAWKTAYADKASEPEGFGNTNDTVELWAVWTNNPYTVFFDLGDGGGWSLGKGYKIDCWYDKPFNLPEEAPTNATDGLVFDGWRCDETGQTYAINSVVSNLTAEHGGTVKLVATWKYDVGDWSRALGCTNLVFHANGNAWGVLSDFEGVARCVYHNKSNIRDKSPLEAKIYSSGTLSFRYFGFDKTPLEVSCGMVMTNLESMLVPNQWNDVHLNITLPDGLSESMISIVHDDEREKIYIADLTWTPGEGPQPGPVPGPALKGMSTLIDDLQNPFLFLSYVADDQFDYRLLGTNELSAPMPWPVVFEAFKTNIEGTAGFAIPINAAKPNMFYCIETLQKVGE